uniref:Uncharacterized protein n=1 Tax=Candidatus Kentrum sp. LFY TaxID=2126342 RepID=A0A450UFZ8_9GAMM|nr:MAG: hypothetical protein BECKLFY1418A_GA0070994_101538 [Candidatus Kentron sp. LFY]
MPLAICQSQNLPANFFEEAKTVSLDLPSLLGQPWSVGRLVWELRGETAAFYTEFLVVEKRNPRTAHAKSDHCGSTPPINFSEDPFF